MPTTFRLLYCALLLAGLMMSACAPSASKPFLGDPQTPYPPERKPQVGDILHNPTGIFVSRDQMLRIVSDARIVYVGETHDNPAAHRLQLDVIKALAERYPDRIAIGMEMFTPAQQEALDLWSAGELTEKQFLKRANWYGTWRMDFAYYREILEYARELNIPVIGLNAEKSLVRKVGQQEIAELDESAQQKIPEMDMEDPYQRALTEAIYGGHSMGEAQQEGFIRVQTLWDETMAANIADYLKGPQGQERRMVVLAGGNHIRYGFGIPRRVFRRLPTSYQLVGSRETEIPEGKQQLDVELPHFPMPAYDFTVFTRYESLDGDGVALGIMLDEKDGAVIIRSVLPESNAAAAGLKKGDRILAIDGEPVSENFDVIYQVKQKKAGESGSVTIEREGQQHRIEIEYTPGAPEHGHRKKEK